MERGLQALRNGYKWSLGDGEAVLKHPYVMGWFSLARDRRDFFLLGKGSKKKKDSFRKWITDP